jgi:AcrR family transcriptional regulator
LTRDDWTAAALRSLAEGGLGAVAVETLADRLGATKGSAYWHFPNREALLTATLRRWERENIEAINRLREIDLAPEARLRNLFASVTLHAEGNAIEVGLLASCADRLVADVLRRVTEQRLAYLEWVFESLGFVAPLAGRRALLAYAGYLGHVQLAHCAANLMPRTKGALRSHLEENMRVLLTAPPE